MTVLLFVSALTRRNFSMTLRENMEKGLLEKKREVEEGGSGVIRWSVFGEEVKRVAYLAAPMVAVTLSQYFLQIISMMMVGRLGKLALSSTAIAISLCNVSGLSVIVSLLFNWSIIWKKDSCWFLRLSLCY